jgi:hypothetical protein
MKDTPTSRGKPASKDQPAYHATILEAIGHTPLVQLNHLGAGYTAGSLLAKVEFFNPAGSVKDRIGISIIEQAEREGRLRPGGTIVEATSGNTGAGLALAAAVKGYRCVFVMPDKMSEEKVRFLRAEGARVVITPTAVPPQDPRSYYRVAERIVAETPNSLLANQYHIRPIPRPTTRPPAPNYGSKRPAKSAFWYAVWARAARSPARGAISKSRTGKSNWSASISSARFSTTRGGSGVCRMTLTSRPTR